MNIASRYDHSQRNTLLAARQDRLHAKRQLTTTVDSPPDDDEGQNQQNKHGTGITIKYTKAWRD